MRVRVLQKTRLYWDYAIHELEKGAEVIDALAKHLFENAPPGAVEVLEADPEPETDPDGGQSEQQDDPGASGEQPPPDGDGPPIDGTIDQLMAWIGDDPDRRNQALAAEQAKDKPRVTVLKQLGATE